jgi:fructose-1-phosphate kinase PfkB-like protein
MVDVPAQDLQRILRVYRGRLLMIKPNQAEFEALVGCPAGSPIEIVRRARKLLPKVEIICVSLARRGVIVVCDEGAWLVQPPAVHHRGSVGAGDSLVGATAACLARFGTDKDRVINAVKWGVAAGAATATTEGTSLGRAALVRKIHARVRVRALPLGGSPR